MHILQDAALIGAIIFLWSTFENSLLRFTVVPLVTAVIFRGFAIMHEAVHGVVSKNRFINDLVGLIGGGFSMLPYESWKASHLQHHQWSGNIEKDPVMGLIIFYRGLSSPWQKVISAIWKCWIPIIGFLQHVVFWQLSAKIYLKQPRSLKVITSLLFPNLFWAALFYMVPLTFSLQVLVPSLFLYFVAVEVVNLPHHLELPQHHGDTKFLAWQQYQTARTCIYPKWFAQFFALNFNYHIEHHMFPDVPWYGLPALHQQVKQALGEAYNTDPHFSWILSNKPKSVNEVIEPAEVQQPIRTSAA
jgi:fatty acid desaturase